jgi:hypothetical protein
VNVIQGTGSSRGSAITGQIEKVQFHGWKALKLSNGLIEAVLVPDVGGRIMAFNMAGHPYLWVNLALAGKLFSPEENQGDGSLASWKNYGGSKTWPAPQGWSSADEWHGPPDATLDTGRYRLEAFGVQDKEPFARLASPADLCTGVCITRQLSLHRYAARATLRLDMENISDRPRRWSIWDVVQIDATRQTATGLSHDEDAWVYIPANLAGAFEGGYKVMFGAQDNPEWHREIAPGIIGVQYLFQVGKIGVDSLAGWVAFTNSRTGFAFIQRFPVFSGEVYPDGGTTVACWTTGVGEAISGLDYVHAPLYHMEAEVVGPLRTMQPGEHQSLVIEWNACRCPGPIVEVTEAGCAHRPLAVQKMGSTVILRGVYGIFIPGIVQLEWQDEQGNPLYRETIAMGSPLEVLQLDLARIPPVNGRRVALVLLEESGVEGLLGEARYDG